MSTALALEPTGTRRRGRSVLAIVAAIVANAGLSLATDQLFHVLGVYPPWGQPMHEPELNALALAYRIAYGVVAGVVVARLAPRAPMRHAAVVGVVGFALATLGAVVAITQYDLGPDWYPVALALVSFPTVWLGAGWHERRRRA
jgi:hypothetical protein